MPAFHFGLAYRGAPVSDARASATTSFAYAYRGDHRQPAAEAPRGDDPPPAVAEDDFRVSFPRRPPLAGRV